MKSRLQLIILIFSLSTSLFSQHTYHEPDSTLYGANRSGMLLQEWDLWVNEVGAVNNGLIADENGEYDDWIEVYNFGDEDLNLSGLYITDNANNPTKHLLSEINPDDLLIPAGGYLILWADNQPLQGARHLNFSLSGSGEYVGLYTQDQVLIDGIEFGQQISNVSYGRNSVGGEWNYFTNPTPGAANGNGLFSLISTPVFSQNDGFITGSIEVSITVDEPDALIYYTLNGSEPTETDALYTTPINIENTTMLRARAFKTDYLPSRVATNTFIQSNGFSLDVISLSTDQSNWFGPSGIYDNRYTGVEKPLHVEYFNNQGVLQFELEGGVKIHAPDNRPQQSLRLYFRSEYGDSEVNYPLFAEKDITSFKRLVLRNGGNDGQQAQRTYFRDVLCHSLFREMDSDNIYSAYKPVNVYLNGVYWGIYNLRERQDKYFTAENLGTEDVDFLERTAETGDSRNAIEGDWTNYDAMKAYITGNDLSDNNNYEVVKNWMDIRNYVDYMVTEIWAANRDWLSNNIKFVRPKNNPSAKWKWVLWDTEYGMGCFPANDHGNPNFDALHMAMSWGGWPPHWGINSTYLMQNLRNNPEFTDYFITRHADLLNSYLRADRVLDRIQELKSIYETDMALQVGRWGGSIGAWNGSISILNNWVNGTGWSNNRNAHCRQHIINKFAHVTDQHIITLNVLPAGAGFIKVNTIQTDSDVWSGYYFEGVPVQLTAIAYPGYEFEEWMELSLSNPNLEVWMNSDSTLTALFEESEFEPEIVVINEINYNSPPWANAEDWIELTNPGNNAILLENWSFKDEDDTHIFVFPEGTVLNAGEFLVLCRDLSMFQLINPSVSNAIGSFDFGLSNNGELLRLFDSFGNLVDFVQYNDIFPWPVEADGTGATIELLSPTLDNTVAQNWFARQAPGGSPGVSNDTLTAITESIDQTLNVYPNPFTSLLNVMSTPYAEPMQIQLFDATGRLIERWDNINNTAELALSHLSAGIFILQVQQGNLAPQTIRVIKR